MAQNTEIVPIWDFREILHHWTEQSAQQLKDSYKMQKLWTGSASDEVWPGWYKENERRKRTNKSGNAWISTGNTFRNLAVITRRDSIDDMQVDFRTTIGALYAEAGVGANGPKAVRGKSSSGRESIAVDRSAPYSSRWRYVNSWCPGRGYAHRPATRMQVGLLRRRLSWLMRKVYLYDFSTYLGATLCDAIQECNNTGLYSGTKMQIQTNSVVPVDVARLKEYYEKGT